MREIPRILVYIVLAALLWVSSINAGEVTLVKVSAVDQRAVIKDDAGHLSVIKVGDFVEKNWEVIGIAAQKVILRKKDPVERTIKMLKIEEENKIKD